MNTVSVRFWVGIGLQSQILLKSGGTSLAKAEAARWALGGSLNPNVWKRAQRAEQTPSLLNGRPYRGHTPPNSQAGGLP